VHGQLPRGAYLLCSLTKGILKAAGIRLSVNPVFKECLPCSTLRLVAGHTTARRGTQQTLRRRARRDRVNWRGRRSIYSQVHFCFKTDSKHIVSVQKHVFVHFWKSILQLFMLRIFGRSFPITTLNPNTGGRISKKSFPSRCLKSQPRTSWPGEVSDLLLPPGSRTPKVKSQKPVLGVFLSWKQTRTS
jgi:hypothetical protein